MEENVETLLKKAVNTFAEDKTIWFYKRESNNFYLNT